MAVGDTRPDLPSPHAHAQDRTGALPPAAREVLGRLVHAERLAANAAKERPFGLLPWEGRSEEQRELDMRIGEAVAGYALTENAITWGTSCLSCARVLDSAYAETVRREAAEARLRQVAALCREHPRTLTVEDVLRITGAGEGPS